MRQQQSMRQQPKCSLLHCLDESAMGKGGCEPRLLAYVSFVPAAAAPPKGEVLA